MSPNSLLLSDDEYDDLLQNKITWNSAMAGNSNSPYGPTISCATTTVLSAVYYNGANNNGQDATLTNASYPKPVLKIDGYTPIQNDLILVRDQTDNKRNGIYKLSTVGVLNTTDWVLTRANDADTIDALFGKLAFVNNTATGATITDKVFKNSLKNNQIVGVNGHTWTAIDSWFGADVATTLNLSDYTYATNKNYDATITKKVNGATASIDGVSLTLGMRVLVKNQDDATQNGLYYVSKVGTSTEKFVLTRSTNANTPATLALSYVYVNDGNTNSDQLFRTLFKLTDKIGLNSCNWVSSPLNVYVDNINWYSDLGNAGIIVLNSQKTTVNNFFEGYYVAIADNKDFNPSTDYLSIANIKSINAFGDLKKVQEYITVPNSRLGFPLTQAYATFGADSISKAVETSKFAAGFEKDDYKDSIVLTVFKIAASQYGKDNVTLDYSLVEGYNGSLYSGRNENTEMGGTPVSRFIDTVVENNSSFIKVITNPYISDYGNWDDKDGKPSKNVLVDGLTKNAYSIGSYTGDSDVDNLQVGNIPDKLGRILYRFENDETIDIDVIPECGLGTIWASSKVMATATLSLTYVYDEEYNVDLTCISGTDGSIPASTLGNAYEAYNAVVGQFVALADKTRKDHLFIADPLRNIFVNGADVKTSSRRDYVFSDDIYWRLKNQFAAIQSSYVATYGNWLKVSDNISNKPFWCPSSAFAAAIIAETSQTTFPWIAPAGFNRGTLNGVFDLAINPTQKQRDLLYKINMNPIAYFVNDGFVIYGQKTMFKKPSAFDRINVRRLFLVLEKETKALLKYFVFEPNTFSTRNRLKGALLPIFEKAKLNDGLYDYQLICDERNNLPEVIAKMRFDKYGDPDDYYYGRMTFEKKEEEEKGK
jgi:hypothetical protein